MLVETRPVTAVNIQDGGSTEGLNGIISELSRDVGLHVIHGSQRHLFDSQICEDHQEV